MNIIFWNIRGIGNNDSRIALSNMSAILLVWCMLSRIHMSFLFVFGIGGITVFNMG